MGGIWYPFADYGHHALFHFPFICPFESVKFGKEGKELQNFQYLENENSFLDEIKKNFNIFLIAIIFLKKKKKKKKIADTSFSKERFTVNKIWNTAILGKLNFK